MKLALLRDTYVGKELEVSQPFARYASNALVLAAICLSGEADIFVDGSNDLENWAQIGTGPLVLAYPDSWKFGFLGTPLGYPLIGAAFLRLRFKSRNADFSIATAIVTTSVM